MKNKINDRTNKKEQRPEHRTRKMECSLNHRKNGKRITETFCFRHIYDKAMIVTTSGIGSGEGS